MPGVVELVGLFVLGLLVGTYGTLVGAGGGPLIVPALLLIFHLPPQQAVGTSLTVVFLNALSGTISYARQKRVDYRTGLRFAVATIPGSIIGAYVSTFFTGRLFGIVFGVLLLLLAGFIIFRPREAELAVKEEVDASLPPWYTRRVITDVWGERYEYTFNEPAGVALSFVVGFLSSILGIGGGIIHVPAMVYLFSFPPHIATATSHFILAISALVGAGSHLLLGHVVPRYGLPMALGVVLGAQLGARLSQRLHGVWILRFLSLALVLVGLRLILGQVVPG